MNVQFCNAIYAKTALISLKVTEIETKQVVKYAQIDCQLRILTQMVQGLAAQLLVVLGVAKCTNYEFVREEDKEKPHWQCFINAPVHT